MKTSYFWSLNRQWRRSGSLNQEEEISEEGFCSWRDGIHILDASGEKGPRR